MKKMFFNALYGAGSFSMMGIFLNGINATFPSPEKSPMGLTGVYVMAFFGALVSVILTWLIRREEKKYPFKAF